MRKLVICNMTSLDGYHDGPGTDVMALPLPTDAYTYDWYFLERIWAADTLLLGRTSYEAFVPGWPQKADDPTAPEVHREFGAHYQTHAKVVVSDSLAPDDITAYPETTTVVRRADIAGWLAEYKEQPGRDILSFGSRTTWTPLLAAGLVDELHLLVGPGAVTDGTPLFAEPIAGLRLLEARHLEGSDCVMLSYATA